MREICSEKLIAKTWRAILKLLRIDEEQLQERKKITDRPQPMRSDSIQPTETIFNDENELMSNENPQTHFTTDSNDTEIDTRPQLIPQDNEEMPEIQNMQLDYGKLSESFVHSPSNARELHKINSCLNIINDLNMESSRLSNQEQLSAI